MVFALSSLATVASVIAIERAEGETRKLELARDGAEIASGIQRRAAENVAVLSAAGALFNADDEVSHRAFVDFVGKLASDDIYQGSLGLGWARKVRTNQLWQFEKEMRESLRPDFSVRPLPGAKVKSVTPIVYLEPQTEPNRDAVGYDMQSEPVRREAMDRSIELGRPVMSGKVHLVQDSGDPEQAGFLIYTPVYTRTDGDADVRGFVYSPFNAEKFLESASLLFGDRTVDMALYDQSAESENLLAEKVSSGRSANRLEMTMKVADRNWVLVVSDKAPDSFSFISQAAMVFGSVLALLLTIVARMVTLRAADDRKVLEFLTRQSAIRTSLTRELNHRVKNTLANVLSIVSLTRKRYDNLDDFAESLSGRIRALSATHDLLSQSDWSNAGIREVVESELAPYSLGHDAHVLIDGPELDLAPNDALSLGLAIHELATNAAKYGALSVPDGSVSISWELAAKDRAQVVWQESGGPTVRKPQETGFGIELIQKVVAHELKTEVDLSFDPKGVRCTFHVPVRTHGEFTIRQG